MDDGAARDGADVPLTGAVRPGAGASRTPHPTPREARGHLLPPLRGSASRSTSGQAEKVDLDWEEVRRLYELSGTPVSAIRARFGLTAWQFRKARVQGNWTTRAQVARPGPLQGHKPVGEESLDFRLSRLVAVGIDVLEKRVAEEGLDEQSARTLRELCRAQEIRMRSKRTEKAAKAREKKNNNGGPDFRDDPEWLLAEIDRKLGRLAAKDEARGTAGAGKADPGGARSGDA